MAFSTNIQKRWTPSYAARLVGLSCLVTAAGCSEPTSAPQVGSNTNWLTACEADSDCTESLDCNCKVCSKVCDSNRECATYPGTVCVLTADDAANALCGGSVSWAGLGICLPPCEPGGCGDSQACALGACVPLALPNLEFCSVAAVATTDSRSREDELALVAEQARVDGGIACGNATVTSASAFVRIEPRLTCAARVLAQDIAATGVQSLTDSSGRVTTDRLLLAGYQPTFWVEGYAWDVSSASAALQAMLADADFCTGFSGAEYLDLGVGYSAGVYVLTLAAE